MRIEFSRVKFGRITISDQFKKFIINFIDKVSISLTAFFQLKAVICAFLRGCFSIVNFQYTFNSQVFFIQRSFFKNNAGLTKIADLNVWCITLAAETIKVYTINFASHRPLLVSNYFKTVIVPTFDTKVTEYLCSGWVFFFFRQISTF